MSKFTISLLSAVAITGLTAAAMTELKHDGMVSLLQKGIPTSPKVIAESRVNNSAKSESARTLRKPSKKLLAKKFNRKRSGLYAQAQDEGVIYSCSFDFLTEGSETDPAPLELDDWDNIPEELVGEENYGFGGQGLMQAGGAVYIPFEYPDDPDDEDPWMLEGMLWTPDLYEPMDVVIELDAKIAPECDIESDELWAYASDYYENFDMDSAEITTEWSHLTLKIDAKAFLPESDDDSYYFTLFAEGGADILIKNVVIKGEVAELRVPVAMDYTDFTGDSFTAHWTEVEGATGYYLTVYNFDLDTRTNTTPALENQFTEENQFTVTGLTPGNFYSYQVSATNGSFTTAGSNFVIVCELPAPTGVSISATTDNDGLNIKWDETPGANYYVLTASSIHDVTAGQTVMLADADFSGVESTGTVSKPEESEFWYESHPELPGWRFNLGCSAPGAFGFWDNATYTAMTGLLASLSSQDYDLSNAKDAKVNVTIEAASPGNGMLAGLLTLNEAENKYGVASAYGTPENLPVDYETYSFDLTGATDHSQFLFITRTEGNADGAVLIRKLQISAEAKADGSFGMPVGTKQTAETSAIIEKALEDGVTYSVVVVPYLVDNHGNVLAIGKASEPVSFKADLSGINEVFVTEDSDAIYYNLQGEIINRVEKGTVVIKVVGGKAAKIIL